MKPKKIIVIGGSAAGAKAAAKARRLYEFAEITCSCKISLRGYEAAIVLRAHSFTNVHVMEGGIMAWPYPRKNCRKG